MLSTWLGDRTPARPARRPRLRLQVTQLEDRTVPTLPYGSFDLIDRDGVAQGWAFDPDSSSSSSAVDLYVDDSFQGRFTTTGYRSDVNSGYGITGNHGFNLSIPNQYRNGSPHTVKVYAIDTQNSQTYTYLGARSFTESPALAQGNLDFVDANGTVAGWAYDSNTPDYPVNVAVYVDTNQALITPTTVYRSDINSAFNATGNHGFQVGLPASAKDGREHTITAYAFDNSGAVGNPLLSGSFKFMSPNAAFTIQSPTSISGGGPVVLSTRNNYAGAISSIQWNGQEFIDSTDHGRLLQANVAARPTNTAVLSPGTALPVNEGYYNPTEGGSYYDSYTSVTAPNGYAPGRPSTSRVLSASNPAGNQLTTQNQMAFWGQPGKPAAQSPTDLTPSANNTALSNYYVDKSVTIGGAGLPANVIAINTTFTIPAVDQDSYVKIVPMIAFFSNSLFPGGSATTERYNRSARRVEPIGNGTNYSASTYNPNEVDPILVSSPGGGYSFGLFNEKFSANTPFGTFNSHVTYTEMAQSPSGYMTDDFMFDQKSGGPFVSGTFQFRTYFAVGTRQDVINAFTALVAASDSAHDVTPAVTGVTASSAPVAAEQPANAKDNNVNTKWLANGTGANSGASIQYTLNGQYSAGSYSITSANDYPTRDPRDWRFEGSNDAVNWATLDTRSGEAFNERFATKTYQVTQNAGSYRYYRLTITANNGSRETSLGGTGLVQLSEFRLASQ